MYLDAAEDVARWIRETEGPNAGRTGPADLYYGTAGVVLFFLEAHRATGDPGYLRDACLRADSMPGAMEREEECGLHLGIAGPGFVLLETSRITGDRAYREAATRCVTLLSARARAAGAGVQWNETTDIISGGAGTGLFLLHAARELDDPSARELAVRAGRRLVELGRPAEGGVDWAMDPDFPRIMPNLSHGTAGVCYFLADLYAETGQDEFLTAATAGARHLLAIADTRGGGCLVRHDEPDNPDLHYLGWCHGPAGTAGLFRRLSRVTGDPGWMEWVWRGARSVLESDIPEKPHPGVWNVSQCCGSAGIAEFFLELHRMAGRPEHLEFAKRVTADLLARATRTEAGLTWVHAERRVAPDERVAHVGYMLGAAGIGVLLLHLHEHEVGIERAVSLLDTMW
jgi:lantibiotic modifying enzyme